MRARQNLTDFWAAMEVGPAREGIQKKPSVNSPSSATFDSALQSTSSLVSELQPRMKVPDPVNRQAAVQHFHDGDEELIQHKA